MSNSACTILDRPGLVLSAVGTVYEHGVAGVDIAGDVGVTAGAEDRGGAGVGVDAGEVVRAPAGSSGPVIGDGLGVVEEEGARGGVELPLRAAKDEGTELE